MVSNKSVIKNNFLKSKTHATPTEDRQLTRTLALLLLLDPVRTNHGSKIDVNEDQENGMMNAENFFQDAMRGLRNGISRIRGSISNVNKVAVPIQTPGTKRVRKLKKTQEETTNTKWTNFVLQWIKDIRPVKWIGEKFSTYFGSDKVMKQLKEAVLDEETFHNSLKSASVDRLPGSSQDTTMEQLKEGVLDEETFHNSLKSASVGQLPGSSQDTTIEQLEEIFFCDVPGEFDNKLDNLNDVNVGKLLDQLDESRKLELILTMLVKPKNWNRVPSLMKKFPNTFNWKTCVTEAFRRLLSNLAFQDPEKRHLIPRGTLNSVLGSICGLGGRNLFEKNGDILEYMDKLISEKPATCSGENGYSLFYSALDAIKEVTSNRTDVNKDVNKVVNKDVNKVVVPIQTPGTKRERKLKKSD